MVFVISGKLHTIVCPIVGLNKYYVNEGTFIKSHYVLARVLSNLLTRTLIQFSFLS